MVLIVKSKRVYLNLFAFDLPLTAIASIIHRATGLLLFVLMPLVLYFFKLAVGSESSFDIAVSLMSTFYIKTLVYCFVFALIYHLIGGVKHMIMDLGYFDGKTSGKNFTIFSLVLFFIFVIVSVLV